MKTTVKLLWETQFEKAEQTIIKGSHGTMTYTTHYRKSFHKSYDNGFIWQIS